MLFEPGARARASAGMMGDIDDRRLLEHVDFLRRLARRLVAREDEADDLVQDTFAAALASPRRPRRLRAWLGRIARNRAVSRWRKEHARRDRERASGAGPRAAPGPSEAAAQLELQRRIVEAVRELDPPYREAIVQRYYYGLGPAEIARRLGLPRETVRTRLGRALARLRARLDERHGGARAGWFGGAAALAYGDAAAKSLLAGKAAALAAATLLLAAGTVGWVVHAADGAADEERAPRVAARGGERREAAPEPAGDGGGEVAPDETERHGLRGVVRDEEHAEIAGARVELRSIPPGMESAGLWFTPPGRVADRATTGPEGTFHFVPAGEGPWLLTVTADGYLTWDKHVYNPDRGVSVTLERGVERSLRVLDPEGQPVAGAEVTSLPWTAKGLAGMRVRTDRDGRATLRAPEKDNLVVRAEGYAWTMIDRRDDVEEVRLEPGYALAGRVVDDLGRPVPEAWLEVKRFFFGEQAVVVGRAGRFRIAGLPKKRLSFIVRAPRHFEAHRLVWPGDEDYEVVLPRTGSVRGRVLGPDGAPVEGVRVLAANDSDRTGADGRFLCREVRPGEIEVSAFKEPHLVAGIVVRVEPRKETTGVVLRLASRYTDHVEGLVRLRIVDPEGAPVEGLGVSPQIDRDARSDASGFIVARVRQRERRPLQFQARDPRTAELSRALKTGKGPGPWHGSVTARPADEPGEAVDLVVRRPMPVDFVVRGPTGPLPRGHVRVRHSRSWRVPGGRHLVYAGERYTLEVSAPGHLPREIRGWTPPEGGGRVEFRLERGRAVRGEVVDPDGAPLADVFAVARKGHGAFVHTSTDEAGRFSLPASAGRYLVLIHTGDGRTRFARTVRVAGRDVDLGRIVLREPRPVSGRVTDARGRPLGGVLVWPEVPDGNMDDGALTRADGRFTVLVPVDVPGLLRFEKKGRAAVPRSLAELAPERPGTVVMHRGVEVRYRVADRRWRHDEWVRDVETGVRWSPEGRRVHGVRVLEDLPPRRLVLELVGRKDDRRIERALDLRAGQAVVLDPVR